MAKLLSVLLLSLPVLVTCGGANESASTTQTTSRAPVPVPLSASALAAALEGESVSNVIGFGVLVETPYSRIADSAHSAKARMEAFAVEDITPEMAAPEIAVHVPSARDIQTVIIAPVGSMDTAQIIRPGHVEKDDANNNLIAYFPLDAMTPQNEVRIVYDARIPYCSRPGPARGTCIAAVSFDSGQIR